MTVENEPAQQPLCDEDGCDEPALDGYCAHHMRHSAADGECGPGCPPPGGTGEVTTRGS